MPDYTTPYSSHESMRRYREFRLLCETPSENTEKSTTKMQWKIVDASDQTVLYTFYHENKAKKTLESLAKDHRPSRVVIVNSTGKICGSSLYP